MPESGLWCCPPSSFSWRLFRPAPTLPPSPTPRDHEPFTALTAADRRLTLALLSYSDSLRVYTNGHGQRETIGQHRICWARTAGVRALPMWFDATTVRPPRDATILQRGYTPARSLSRPAQVGGATPPATAL